MVTKLASEEVRSPDSFMLWAVGISAVLILVLHLWAALFPSAANWGVQQLGFYPVWVMVSALLAMSLFMIPAIQKSALRIVQAAPVRLLRGGRLVQKGLILLCSAFIFWIGRERVFFLGDGFLITGWLGRIEGLADIPRLFRNEPLAGYLNWKVYQLLNSWNVAQSNAVAVQVVSVAFGLGGIAAIYWLSRRLFKDATDAALFGGFIAVSAGSQLFFGYVEDYAPLYFAVLLFAASAVAYLRGDAPLLIPSVVYGAMFAIHFGMICLLPSLALLWYQSVRKGRPLAVPISLAAMIVTSGLLLWLCGYTLASFADVFLNSERHFIPVTAITSNWQAYTLFSLNHLTDLANLQLLLSPFAGVLLLSIVALRSWTRLSNDIVWTFIVIVMVCGLIFTFLVNSDLGVSRDWDLLASFNLGVAIASAYTLISIVGQPDVRRRLMVLVIAITLVHTASWIGINADEQRSIARFNILQDGRFWGKSALANASETMGGFYRDKNDYVQARNSFARYLEIDSTNGRIWASASQIFSKLGDEAGQKYCYEKAIQCRTTFEAVYLDLGRMYAKEKKYEQAIEVLKKGLAVDSTFVLVNEFLGEYYVLASRSYRQALPYFLRAIRLDPRYSRPYYAAGDCYQYLGDLRSTKWYWANYIRLKPDAPEGPQIREILRLIK